MEAPPSGWGLSGAAEVIQTTGGEVASKEPRPTGTDPLGSRPIAYPRPGGLALLRRNNPAPDADIVLRLGDGVGQGFLP